MKLSTATIAMLACACFGGPAPACDLLDATKISLKRRPVLGNEARLTSGFGMMLHPILQMMRMHPGVDWAAPTGTPVIAAADGRVVSTSSSGGYGNTIVIEHGSGWQTVYAHLSSFRVHEGDCVKGDAVIGAVGATGLAEGPHLHFEVKQNGQPIDPLSMRQPSDTSK